MATTTLPQTAAATAPSDADLLNNAAALLKRRSGQRLTEPLSDVLKVVCSQAAPADRGRAVTLEALLAGHLVDAGALRLDDDAAVEPALDAWASKVLIKSVCARLTGCARCVGGA